MQQIEMARVVGLLDQSFYSGIGFGDVEAVHVGSFYVAHSQADLGDSDLSLDD
jgi:hypothetical protein